MDKKTPNFYNFIVDAGQAENFFNQNAPKIFGSTAPVKVLEVKRAYTYNKDSYNVFYKVYLGDQLKEIRVSASRVIDKEKNYLMLKHFFENGFDQGRFLVPKPLAYFKDLNLMMYEHVDGEIMMEHLDSDLNTLTKRVETAALLMQKVHSLPKPDFEAWDPSQFFEFKDFEEAATYEFYPQIRKVFPQIIEKAKILYSEKDNFSFCHGDFQPSNLLFNEQGVYLLDLDLACSIQKEYDIATFVNQSAVMVARYNDFGHIRILKKKFLANYNSFDEENFHVYGALINTRILSVFSLTNTKEHNEKYMPVAFENLKQNLFNLNIHIDG